MRITSRYQAHPSATRRAAIAALTATALASCATVSYEPQPLDATVETERFQARSLDSEALRAFMEDNGHAVEDWPLKEWDFRALWLATLFYHPQLDVARAEWRVRQASEITAAQHAPPRINMESEHHSENGSSPWSLGVVVDFLFEWPDQREARIDAARARSESARLDIGTAVWNIHRELRQRFLDVQDLRMQVRLSAIAERTISEAVKMLERRHQVGEIGSLDVSTMRLRLQRTKLELSTAQTGVVEARLDLAAAMGVPPAALEPLRIALTDDLGTELPEPDRLSVREQALTHRYDVRRALSDYVVAEAALREAVAQQYPDITLSPGFLYDQGDQVWILDASWLLLLSRHTEGPIAEARAQRDLAAARFKALQAEVIAQLEKALARYRGALDVLETADALLEEQREQEAQVQRRLEIGYSDRLELLNAKIETLAARQARHEAWIAAHSALGRLENTVQRPLDDSAFTKHSVPTSDEDNGEES